MSRNRTELNLHANDSSLLGRLLGAEDAKTQLNTKDIDSINTISENTTTITLVGHSGESTFGTSTNLASRTAEQLADEIAKKYQGNKRALEHFNLISCEAGLANPGPSYAQKLADELYKKGFINVQVHAMKPPELKIPAYGMIVQTSNVYTGSSAQLAITAWCYRSHKQEQRDLQIEKRLKKLEDTVLTEKTAKERLNSRDSLNAEKAALKKERSELRLYVCANTPYQDALSASQSCITPSQVIQQNQSQQQNMHEYVAFAISFLNSKKTVRGNDGPGDIQFIIERLQRHPEIDSIDGIINKCSHKFSRINPKPSLSGELQRELSAELATYISNTRDRENQILSEQTVAQNARNVANNATVVAQEAKDWISMVIRFFQRLRFICGKEDAAPEPFKAAVAEVGTALENYTADNSTQNKTNLQASLQNLKTYLNEEIQKYLDENQNPQTEQQKDKNFLMEQFKTYLNTQKNSKGQKAAASNIQEVIGTENNTHRLWDKGMASRVKAMKLEFEKFKEVEKGVEEAPTPRFR